MSQTPDEPPRESTGSTEPAAPRSALGRAGRFLMRHPLGVVEFLFLFLVAVVVLQNLEPTSIDVLFWSFPALPKLVLMFASMLVGAAAWEIVRRLLR